MKVCVLGGGIAGLMTAYYLLERGHRVTLVERRPGPALETSRSNAGLLTPSQSLPWNAPGIVSQALRWLLEENGALVIHPRLDPAMWAWLARFTAFAREPSYSRHARATLALAELSVSEVDAVASRHGIVFDRTASGVITLVRDSTDRNGAIATLAQIRSIGPACRLVEREEVLAMEPALGPIADRFDCALLTEGDGSGDIHKFCAGVARVLADGGTEFHFGSTVRTFRIERGRVTAAMLERGEIAADAFVLALGSTSRQLARSLGFGLKLYPVQGCSVTVSTEGWPQPPRLPVRDGRLKVAVTPLGDRIRVAGMAVLNSGSLDVPQRWYDSLRHALNWMFPDLPRDNPAENWTGLRPMTPDGPPLLGATPYANLWLNTGHGPLGWTMGCGSAKVVAGLIDGEEPPFDLRPYRHDRYRF